MDKVKRTVGMVILVILAIGGLVGGYFWYQDSNYFYTEDARLAANMVNILPEMTGKIAEWNIKEGDDVKSGDILGRQDVSGIISSSTINAQAMVSSADQIAAKANIETPISGRVIKSNVVIGQVVSPAVEVATIADIPNIYVSANIEETEISKIQPKQKVDIRIDAFKGKQFSGYVETVGQATDSVFSTMPSLNTSGEFSKTTQLIPLKISILNEDNLNLMPGMNVNVKIHIS